MVDSVRLSQQYAEVVESGTNNTTRLSQQYAEVVESGTNNAIRLSQQYAEVVVGPFVALAATSQIVIKANAAITRGAALAGRATLQTKAKAGAALATFLHAQATLQVKANGTAGPASIPLALSGNITILTKGYSGLQTVLVPKLNLIINGWNNDARGGMHYWYRTPEGDNGPLPPA